jgi:XTP/dITP diphosphohydrolase
VISAHYGGLIEPLPDREATRRLQDARNNERLLANLAAQPGAPRRAFFISTLVALRHAADPQPLVAVGRWPGLILDAPRGEQGFGYDPLMFIPELGRSVAELDAVTKNGLSHRARAMVSLREQLREVWGL